MKARSLARARSQVCNKSRRIVTDYLADMSNEAADVGADGPRVRLIDSIQKQS